MKQEISQTFIQWTYLGNDEKQHLFGQLFQFMERKTIIVRAINEYDINQTGEDISPNRMPETIFYHNSCPVLEKRFNQCRSIIIGGDQ